MRGIDGEGDERQTTGSVPVTLSGIKREGDETVAVPVVLRGREGDERRTTDSSCACGIQREGDKRQTTGPVPVALRGIEREGDERQTNGLWLWLWH